MSIVTGSEGLEEPKDPENCNVFALIKFFATQQKQDEIAAKYRAGNYGYGHAKLELLDIILKYFEEPRKRFEQYMQNPELIQQRLQAGNQLANTIVQEKYNQLIQIVGL